ncbi:MAG: flagellar biosynthetic protein FliQ [Verrucomicrobiota bacterium]
MSIDEITELMKLALVQGLLVLLPIALGALLTGLILGLLQTVTSIQEQTLTFIPKLAAAAAMVYLLGPWMLQRLGDIAVLFIERAGDVLR